MTSFPDRDLIIYKCFGFSEEVDILALLMPKESVKVGFIIP
jgi:hypothetical protein